MNELIPNRSKIVLDEIREIVDPDDQMTDSELVACIEKIFAAYAKSRNATRKRVKRFRERQGAMQDASDA